jgi:hypothetical protein
MVLIYFKFMYSRDSELETLNVSYRSGAKKFTTFIHFFDNR